MAYQVYARTPGGSAKSYIDTNTSEIISARQYRNRTEAARSGFASISQKQTASKYTRTIQYTEKEYQKIGHVHHTYNLGVPNDLEAAIKSIINRTPQFGYGMMLEIEYAVYTDRTTKQWIGTRIWKKSVGNVRRLLDDINSAKDKYNTQYIMLSAHIVLVDYL